MSTIRREHVSTPVPCAVRASWSLAMNHDDPTNTVKFKVLKNGLHATEPGQKRRRVGPYLKKLSTASYENDDTVFVRLKFDRVTGARITKQLPRADLRKPLLIGKFLENHGYGSVHY